MTDTTVTTEPPLQNDPTTRTPAGEIKDVREASPQTTTPETTPKAETTPPKADTTSADSSKPTEEKKPNTKPATAAPEKYADFTAPEGITLDAKVIESATPLFKDLGLTQDQAQKLVSWYGDQQKALVAAPNEAFQATVKQWRADTAAHADIKNATVDGKTGVDAAMINIGRAKDMLPADLRTEFELAMNSTGVGDHPAFVRALNKFGQLFGEGKFVTGGGPSPHGQRAPNTAERPSAAQAMFPRLASGAPS